MATSEAWSTKIARQVTPAQRREVLITADAGRVVLTETGVIRMRLERPMGPNGKAVVQAPVRCDRTVRRLVAEGLLIERTSPGNYLLTERGKAELERVR